MGYTTITIPDKNLYAPTPSGDESAQRLQPNGLFHAQPAKEILPFSRCEQPPDKRDQGKEKNLDDSVQERL